MSIFLYKYNINYKIKGVSYLYKFPKFVLNTYSEKKRPYRNLSSIALINYMNTFDHINIDTNNSFMHYLAEDKYLYSNIKSILLK